MGEYTTEELLKLGKEKNEMDFAKPYKLTDGQIIRALNSADLFLRNRANAKPAPLNKYDISELLDIANVCVNALDLIKRLKAENERLNTIIRDRFLDVNKQILEAQDEARKEFAEKLKRYKAYVSGWDIYVVREHHIDNLLKEMETGDTKK